MKSVYLYSFSITGFDLDTETVEDFGIFHIESKDGLTNSIYQKIRKLCHSFFPQYRDIEVRIERLDLTKYEHRQNERPYTEYIGMWFFDKCDLYTHRGIVMRTRSGKPAQWGVYHWR